MLALLVVAASLITQAYLFRVTPSHPANPCDADVSLCPEERTDSLLAAREVALERMRKVARGENPDSATVAVPQRKPASPSMDEAQAEAYRLTD